MFAVGRRNITIVAWSALAGNRLQDASLLTIYPDRNALIHFYRFMQAHNLGLSVDAPKMPAVVAGNLATPRVAGIPTLTTKCVGFIDVATLFGSDVKINGWAYDISTNAAPDRVMLVSGSGEILTTAIPDIDRPDVARIDPEVHSSRVGWSASVPLTSVKTLRAFAVNERLHTACVLTNGVSTK